MNLNLMVFIQEEMIYLKKEWAYVKQLDWYKSIGMHWIALYVIGDNEKYFGSWYISKEIKKFIGNKNIATNIYRM